MIAAVGLVCGGMLGSRFTVYVLVPAHLLVIGLAVGAVVTELLPATRAFLATASWSLGCHAGYFAAAVVASALRSGRSHRRGDPSTLHRLRS